MKHKKIIYIGQLWEGGTCRQRLNVLKDLGHSVVEVDTSESPKVQLAPARIFNRISNKFFQWGCDYAKPVDIARANMLISNLAKKSRNWNILWIDKGLTIEPETLAEFKIRCPQCLIVGYSPDDMFARHNQTKQFIRHLPLYDIFFTTKSYNVCELEQMGCSRVEFIGNAFDLHSHRPMKISNSERQKLGGKIGFIGAYERERYLSMLYLAQNNVPVRIWGTRWNRRFCLHDNVILENKGVWGDDYAKAICAFDINLCFLRKINRDLQTTRSMEIPACGAFMLAERTEEHLSLFEESKEAEFFSSNEELLDKVLYYLAHPNQRQHIAKLGRERCLKSGYSNYDRMKHMLKIVESSK
ncbi:MAG: hypothetical protein B6I30_10050 [Desulfobacteraceae bacterium 4572_187]|nr:MAG: hypothetical protein B6I30_10050 [Desulfobacteraceae bacterium 4572_187]